MNFFEPTHLIIVAVIVLLLFGGEKLPELMRGVGKGVGELKKGIEEGKRQLSSAIDEHQHEEIKYTPPTDTIHRVEPEDHMDHPTTDPAHATGTPSSTPSPETPHKDPPAAAEPGH